jgi:hypothetical protein
MDGLIEFIAAAFVVAAYCALIVAYFVFAAPLVGGLAALYVAGDLVAGYFHRTHAVLVRHDTRFRAIPPYRPGTAENGPEPAYRQYFFGPATRDLRQVIIAAWERGRARTITHASRFTATTLTAPVIPVLFSWPVGITLWAGLVAGVAAGAVLSALLAVVHIAAVLCAQLAARACILALRACDTVALYARGIRGMRCPWCYEKNTYPAYRCECNRRHRDIRPGRYGVFRRRCQCGRPMRTLILLGSYRLSAYCLYCDQRMSDETGRFRELVVPLLGGRAAGKTRLMAAMMVGLHEMAGRPDVGIRLANSETRNAYDVLSTVLDASGHILATPGALPHGHAILLTAGQRTSLVHFFDPAGERLVDRDRTDALRYLPAGRTFIFVIDPMAVPGFWDSLTDEEAATLDRTLASRVDPQEVFDKAVLQAMSMGARMSRSRLAVAISKTDLVERTRLFDDRADDGPWIREWLTGRLGLGNLVRSMETQFGAVEFFFTAAITVAPGTAHPSIAPLTRWVLGLPPP